MSDFMPHYLLLCYLFAGLNSAFYKYIMVTRILTSVTSTVLIGSNLSDLPG